MHMQTPPSECSTYKLLSMPPDVAANFNRLERLPRLEWYADTDPAGRKVGSGGGTTWLVERWLESTPGATMSSPKIIIHAGGQSRRLPAYAPEGKILTPIPVFRWARGQKLDQNLLSLQMPLFQDIMEMAPAGLNTLIASGDVLIRNDGPLPAPPEGADVVCYGIWVDPELASHHGVFASLRTSPGELDFMMQKPDKQRMESLASTHLILMDIGVWLLSDRAMALLMERSHDADGSVRFYDLYSDFGRALGARPELTDSELSQLRVAIVPMHRGSFYHFGTSRELISSTRELQQLVVDQRKIIQRKIKASPALFVQNALMGFRLTADNDRVWVENSAVPASWSLSSDHIITGVPRNDWALTVPAGVCVDIIPVGDDSWAVRPYGINDAMRGPVGSPDTMWMGRPVTEWFADRNIDLDETLTATDIQSAPIFPIVNSVEQMGAVLRWMLTDADDAEGRELWLNGKRLSADGISASANLDRLYEQRREFRRENWLYLAGNHELSVFYQLDLEDAALNYHTLDLPAPATLAPETEPMDRIRNHMLRSRIASLGGADGAPEEQKAFALLRSEILAGTEGRTPSPRLNVYSDQIVWGRSPVRIDVAGGWTDTPPYCISAGSAVVNMAVELNGQPPLQVYIKPTPELHVVLRSIDLGAMEVVETFEQLEAYNTVGSPFAIPKAALTLAGFTRAMAPTLREALGIFGSGMEITLMSAIPAGSGLGTSSILGATVLGALADFCALPWDENEVCGRTLALEQLLTTGGGWQDQYGGVLPGIKLLETDPGYNQTPTVSWLPQQLFTNPDLRACHLLYYTGITRTAKQILAEIVRGMFLNSGRHLALLEKMREHARMMALAIQRGDFTAYGRLVNTSRGQNRRLDSGSETPEITAMIQSVADWTLGCKLPGAGGGGYLYMVAKDPEAAARIRSRLLASPPNPRARFVDMRLSERGFQVSRS